MGFTFENLNERILQRANVSSKDSYTAQLIEKGINKCAQKLGEEAVEAAIAAASGNKKELIGEASDVMYHLLVLLKASDISLDEVMAELENRTAQSGLDEKASR